jgi:hypothetical protein
MLDILHIVAFYISRLESAIFIREECQMTEFVLITYIFFKSWKTIFKEQMLIFQDKISTVCQETFSEDVRSA